MPFWCPLSIFWKSTKQQYFCQTNDVQKKNILGVVVSDWASLAMFFRKELLLCSSPHLRFAATASAALPPRKADLRSPSKLRLLRPRHRLYDRLDLERNIKKSYFPAIISPTPFLPAIFASLVLVHQRVVELAGKALVINHPIIIGLKVSHCYEAEKLGVIHRIQTLLTFRPFAYIPSELQAWHLHTFHTKRTIFDLPALFTTSGSIKTKTHNATGFLKLQKKENSLDLLSCLPRIHRGPCQNVGQVLCSC